MRTGLFFLARRSAKRATFSTPASKTGPVVFDEEESVFMRSRALLLSLFVVPAFVAGGIAQQTTYKITQTVSMQGQNMTNTTWVKGPRKRTATSGMMGMG